VVHTQKRRASDIVRIAGALDLLGNRLRLPGGELLGLEQR
jgi:hypothetical protein